MICSEGESPQPISLDCKELKSRKRKGRGQRQLSIIPKNFKRKSKLMKRRSVDSRNCSDNRENSVSKKKSKENYCNTKRLRTN